MALVILRPSETFVKKSGEWSSPRLNQECRYGHMIGKDMVVRRQGARQAVEEFERVQCTKQLRDPVASDMELLSQPRTIEARLLEIKEETEYLNLSVK